MEKPRREFNDYTIHRLLVRVHAHLRDAHAEMSMLEAEKKIHLPRGIHLFEDVNNPEPESSPEDLLKQEQNLLSLLGAASPLRIESLCPEHRIVANRLIHKAKLLNLHGKLLEI